MLHRLRNSTKSFIKKTIFLSHAGMPPSRNYQANQSHASLTEQTERFHMQTIAVDFDGVIHTYEKGWQDGKIYGELMDGAVAGLSTLMQTYAVFVHTTRKPKKVARWIEKMSGHGIECTTRVPRSGFWNQQGCLLVTNRKLPAYAYIDDRGIRFKSWRQSLTALALIVRQDKAKKDE